MTPKPSPITPQQWDEATNLYELGVRHIYQIAQDLGVHASTVSRQMKLRVAKKGSRSAETVVDLNAFLDRRARREALLRRAANSTAAQRRAQQRAATEAVLGHMIRSLIEADRRGDLTLATDDVDRLARCVGVKKARR